MIFSRYDKIAGHYNAMWPLLVPAYVPILQTMYDLVNVHGVLPRRLLDIGCGSGAATAAVAPACHAQMEVLLVDGSEKMLNAARSFLGSRVRAAVKGDVTEPFIAAQSFVPDTHDLVLSAFALHHLEDPKKRFVIDGMCKSLRPGGMLLLADEIVSDRPAGLDLVERIRSRAIEEHLNAGHINKEFWNIETTLRPEERLSFLPSRIEDLTSWLARAGLAVGCPAKLLGSALLVGIKPTS